MFLKQISIFGFKSFGEKIVLDLPEGITAIVGPNGCGKTNISDAIRWVLGEQNPCLLRANAMSDIIFNGTAKIKPLGVAEVSLVFINHNKILPIDFKEVTITRRLFRSGDSEYLLNKNQCRLKDITNLFLDSGLGKQAYSVLEQSQVNFIVNSKPNQRRTIFEEAVGIIKYKVRKQEAILKLNTTEQNLLRINDLISEIETQKNSLYRQAKKAQRYQQLKKELHKIEITLHLDSLNTINQAYHASFLEIEQLSEELETGQQNLKMIETSFENNRVELKSKHERITQLQSIIFNLQQSIQQYHSQILKQTEQRAYFDSQLAYFENQIQTAKSKLEKNNAEIEIELKKRDELNTKLGIDKDNLKRMEAELDKLVQSKEGLAKKLQDDKIDLIDLLNKLAQTRNQSTSIEIELKNINLRLQRISNEESIMVKKNEGIEHQLASFVTQLQEKEENLIEIENEIKECQQEKELNQKESLLLEGQVNHLREELRVAMAKFQTFEKLKQELEGYLPGVKTLLKSRLDGIGSAIADLIEVPSRYEQAIEVALRSHLQSLIVQTVQHAKGAIKHLKEQKAERVMFLALDSIKIMQKPRLEADVQWAIDLIKYEPKYQAVIEYLLGDVLVSETLEQAQTLIKDNHDYIKVVTLTGELIDSNGVIVGGGSKQQSLGLISRKRELIALSLHIRELQIQQPIIEGKKQTVQRLLVTLTSKLTDAQARLHNEQINLSSLKKDISQLNQFKEDYHRQISLLVGEGTELKNEIGLIKPKIEQLKAKEEQLKFTHLQTEQGIAQIQKELNLKEEEIKKLSLIANQQRVAYAQNIQKKEGANIYLARLETTKNESNNDIKRFELEYKQLNNQKDQQHDQSTEFQIKIDGLEKEKVVEEQNLFLLRGEAHANDELLTTQEQEIKIKRHFIEELKNKLHQLEIRRSEFKIQIDNIQQQLTQEHYTGETEIVDNKIQTPEISRPQLMERINQLTSQLQGLGTLNLLAPAEYEEIKNRFDFMSSQRQDLTLAKKDLQELINQIETTAHQLFQEIFTAVRSNFVKIVKEIFEGGEGDLRLVNGDSPEGAGIEIMIQPRGKRLQSISLLSAGERALVAICLLFAIFQYKPTPFCILDEIDAPLDESNIIRFSKLLSQFSKKTQIFIVTHNKRTVEFADNIYGVTMEEPGISKVLSIQLERR